MAESLFSKKRLSHVRDVFWESNPVSNQALGICSALAVTVKVETALVMTIALIVVVTLSNVIISSIRNLIPNSIRIMVFLIVIAGAVIVIDEILKAFLFEQSKQLSVFVGLIITNCIVMGRAEAFAMGNGVWDSALDGIGSGLGYGLFLVFVSIPREILGSGKLMGIEIIPEALFDAGYQNNGMMLLAPAAFILLGLFIWGQKELILLKGKK